MTSPLIVPSATDTPEAHADFIELASLRAAEDGIALREFVRDLTITGTRDAVGLYEEGEESDLDGDDLYEGIAEAAYAELDDRQQACGGPGMYPFAIDRSVVIPTQGAKRSAYLFMALLSRYGKDAGPRGSNGAHLFEALCASAAQTYLGGETGGASSRVFGFPRRLLPGGFAPALDQLCREVGEGKQHRDSPTVPDQKDAKLDIVAWKDFPDRRIGKLILFGQCATGQDWRSKVTELPQTFNWCRMWMQDVPSVLPMPLFFVPHRVERALWLQTCTLGGILFDRCRVANNAGSLEDALVEKIEEWSAHVISTHQLN